MNGHNNIYFVLFGADRYRPAAHFRACKKRFDHLPAARAYAAAFRNAYIFKAHFRRGGDDPDITEIR